MAWCRCGWELRRPGRCAACGDGRPRPARRAPTARRAAAAAAAAGATAVAPAPPRPAVLACPCGAPVPRGGRCAACAAGPAAEERAPLHAAADPRTLPRALLRAGLAALFAAALVTPLAHAAGWPVAFGAGRFAAAAGLVVVVHRATLGRRAVARAAAALAAAAWVLPVAGSLGGLLAARLVAGHEPTEAAVFAAERAAWWLDAPVWWLWVCFHSPAPFLLVLLARDRLGAGLRWWLAGPAVWLAAGLGACLVLHWKGVYFLAPADEPWWWRVDHLMVATLPAALEMADEVDASLAAWWARARVRGAGR